MSSIEERNHGNIADGLVEKFLTLNFNEILASIDILYKKQNVVITYIRLLHFLEARGITVRQEEILNASKLLIYYKLDIIEFLGILEIIAAVFGKKNRDPGQHPQVKHLGGGDLFSALGSALLMCLWLYFMANYKNQVVVGSSIDHLTKSITFKTDRASIFADNQFTDMTEPLNNFLKKIADHEKLLNDIKPTTLVGIIDNRVYKNGEMDFARNQNGGITLTIRDPRSLDKNIHAARIQLEYVNSILKLGQYSPAGNMAVVGNTLAAAGVAGAAALTLGPAALAAAPIISLGSAGLGLASAAELYFKINADDAKNGLVKGSLLAATGKAFLDNTITLSSKVAEMGLTVEEVFIDGVNQLIAGMSSYDIVELKPQIEQMIQDFLTLKTLSEQIIGSQSSFHIAAELAKAVEKGDISKYTAETSKSKTTLEAYRTRDTNLVNDHLAGFGLARDLTDYTYKLPFRFVGQVLGEVVNAGSEGSSTFTNSFVESAIESLKKGDVLTAGIKMGLGSSIILTLFASVPGGAMLTYVLAKLAQKLLDRSRKQSRLITSDANAEEEKKQASSPEQTQGAVVALAANEYAATATAEAPREETPAATVALEQRRTSAASAADKRAAEEREQRAAAEEAANKALVNRAEELLKSAEVSLEDKEILVDFLENQTNETKKKAETVITKYSIYGGKRRMKSTRKMNKRYRKTKRVKRAKMGGRRKTNRRKYKKTFYRR